MNVALKEYLLADSNITALIGNRCYIAKIDQTAMFPKIAIRLIDSTRKEASFTKVATHKSYMYQIECQGGYDFNGTDKAHTDAMDVAQAVENRLCTLHNSLGKIGTTQVVQIKSMAILDARESQVELDPTTKPTAGAEVLYTYYLTVQFTFKDD